MVRCYTHTPTLLDCTGLGRYSPHFRSALAAALSHDRCGRLRAYRRSALSLFLSLDSSSRHLLSLQEMPDNGTWTPPRPARSPLP